MSVDKSTGPARPAVTEQAAERAIAEAARGTTGEADPTLVSRDVASLPPQVFEQSWESVAMNLTIPEDQLLKLDANENVLGPSDRAREAASAAMAKVMHYPDGAADALRSALAKKHEVSKDHIVVGHGASELIELLVRTFVGSSETVVSAWPSFAPYRLATHAAGREWLMAPLRGHHLDLAGMAALVDLRTKLVFIANPNNPTGTYVARRSLRTFLNRIPDSVIVVLDEAYHEYVTAEDYPDSIRDFRQRGRLVVLRTFSKIYGLAGLRIGYGVMDPKLARFLNNVRQPFNVNSIAQAAALGALTDEVHVRNSQRMVWRGREQLTEGLQKLGLTVVPSQANFVLVLFDRPTQPIFDILARQGIFVRAMGPYQMKDALRITIGTASMNTRLIEALKLALGV